MWTQKWRSYTRYSTIGVAENKVCIRCGAVGSFQNGNGRLSSTPNVGGETYPNTSAKVATSYEYISTKPFSMACSSCGANPNFYYSCYDLKYNNINLTSGTFLVRLSANLSSDVLTTRSKSSSYGNSVGWELID